MPDFQNSAAQLEAERQKYTASYTAYLQSREQFKKAQAQKKQALRKLNRDDGTYHEKLDKLEALLAA